MDDLESRKRKRWFKQALGLTVTIASFSIIFNQIDYKETIEALKAFQWPFLLLGLFSLTIGYLLRIYRWSLMLNSTTEVKYKECAAPFLGSIALNNVLPFRVGDMIRAFIFPASMGISKTVASTSLVMERLIDLMTLLASLTIGVYLIQTIDLPAFIEESALFLAITGSVALILIFLFSGRLAERFRVLSDEVLNHKRKKGFKLISNMCHGFESMSRPRILFWLIFISMVVWLGESGLFYFMMLGFGLDATPAVAVTVMAIATLSTLVPSSPGYVGPFHLAAFTAVSMLGGTTAQASSFAILVHLALWLPTTLAGATALIFNPGLFKAARQSSQLIKENERDN